MAIERGRRRIGELHHSAIRARGDDDRAAHGAVLYTASGAAMRGMKVIVPVDGVSAEATYMEQYVAWHLVNVPVIAPAMTLTTIDNVKF